MNLTLDDVRGISSSEEISETIDSLRLDIAHIEGQIEFRSDGEADDDWERRAIGALAFHRMLLGEALRRERAISGKTVDAQKQDVHAKILKEQTRIRHHEVQRATAEKKIATEAARKNSMNERVVRMAEQVSVDAAFRRAALRILDPEEYERIERAALKQVKGALSHLAKVVSD